MKTVLNNVLPSGNEEEAHRDGYYMRRPNGRLVLTQKALAAFLRHKEQMERLASLVRDALEKGGAVEPGPVDAGLFEEKAKTPNWRGEFIKMGGNPEDVLAATEQKASVRVRVWGEEDEKPRGVRTAPATEAVAESPVERSAAAS